MDIVLIAAVADNGVIGRGGAMPWRLKSDMRHFRALTSGKPVVMGRKTWASLAIRPLPGRTNIVVTRDGEFAAPGALVVPTFEAALQAARADALRRGSEIMIIGGAEIYNQAMPHATRLEITQIHACPEGDARFPPIDSGWKEVARMANPAGPDDDAAYDFLTFRRTSPANPEG